MNTLVSIVCPIYNEEKLIAKTLDSFLAQELNGMQSEILIVDGMSTDDTRKILYEYCQKFPNVQLIDNTERKNPFGRNLGVKNSKGQYVALLGAHTVYNSDYIKICIEELHRTNSIGVSGRVLTAFEKNTTETELCELILTSKFGVSGESFRTVNEGYTSMINYPVFKREVFEKVGLYNTALHRNQDNDFNSRILANGYKLYNTWKTECRYYPSDTLRGTFLYAFHNGFWNGKTIKKNPHVLMIHHYVPLIFVITLLALLVIGIITSTYKIFLLLQIFFLVILFHLLVGYSFSFRIKKYRTFKNIFTLPFVFFIFHFSYGWGTLKGFFTKQI